MDKTQPTARTQRPKAPQAPRPVRTAQRPDTKSELGERVARAWARHPFVALARHRKRLTFYQGLHSLLRAGVPLNVAFTDLSRGAAQDAFRRAIAEVRVSVERGSGLAEAMRRHPKWFEPQAVELLAVSEASGTLEKALESIIAWMEESQRLRWRTLSLCLYPAYLVGAFLIGGAFLEGAGSALAAGSADGVGAAIGQSFLGKLLNLALLGLSAFAAPLVLAALSLEGAWERVRMHIPLLGRFHREVRAGRFCQVLGWSLGAGLDAGRGLQMALEAAGSQTLRGRSGQCLQRLQQGASLTDVVEELGVVEGESLRRIATGERTGHLEPTLRQLAGEHSEAGLRWLRTLVFTAIAVLVALLLATSARRVLQFQGGYYDRMYNLSNSR